MATGPALVTPAPQPTQQYYASIHPGPQSPLPQPLVDAVRGIEQTLNMPVWMFLHNGEGTYGEIDDKLRSAFFDARVHMPVNGAIALLVESPGGYAKSAYQIANIFRRHCGAFTALVPRYAKSAATLLVLGAGTIILNKYAELGPLDAQLYDPEREEWASALNEVQSLERLHAFGMEAIDQTMFLLLGRTRKKTETILPHVLKFVAEIMRPMLEKVDVVHYTQRARVLKVAEEYAIRLLKPKYGQRDAEKMARRLVEKYPEHDFTIDAEELTEIGILNTQPTDQQVGFMDALIPYLDRMTIMGKLEVVTTP